MNTTSQMHHRISPVDGTTTWTGYWASLADVQSAGQRAQLSFETWSMQTLEQRIAIALRFAQSLQNHRTEIARTITLESGKPLWESDSEVQSAISKVANAIEAIQQRRWTQADERTNTAVCFRPLGVMVVLGPYNLPLHLPGAHIVPALLAGNTVLFKPSEKSPAVGEWIASAWREAGLPNGVLELIHGAVVQAKAAVDLPSTAGVLFTGSYAAGKQLHQQLAGRPDCMLALEMGGNNALIVDRVANSKNAIATIIQSAYITSGQRCTCARRLILVNNSQNQELLEQLSRSVARIQVGDPLGDKQPFMGTLVSADAARSILNAQEDYRSLGGNVLVPAQLVESHQAMLTPSLIVSPSSHSRDIAAKDEEHFGPMLVVTFVNDLNDAISLANQTRYGLAAGLISDDAAAYEAFMSRIRAGIANWNCPTTGASGRLPFGGIGASGNHRPSGYYAADYCSYPVAISKRTEQSSAPILPPGLEVI